MSVPSPKQRVVTILEQLPEDCSIEEIQYRLYVAETIRHRLELTESDPGVSQEEVEGRFEQWPT